MTCSLVMRSLVWFWAISVSLLNNRQFLENAWWSSPQGQHMNSVMVHSSTVLYSW